MTMEVSKTAILMYHNIEPDESGYIDTTSIGNRPYILKRSQFAQQMEYLSDNGFHSITLEQLANSITDKIQLPPKSVVLTFDDGHSSNYLEAFPILKRCNFSAIFFITAGFIGKPSMLTRDEIKEMSNSGMDIGSHTLTHPRPSQLTEAKLQYELKESKILLEQYLKKEVKFLSSPTGYYNKAIKQIAKNIGYNAVCTSKFGANSINTDLFSLKRIPIKANYDFKTFQSLVNLEQKTLIYHKLADSLRMYMRNLLGVRMYELFRNHILTIRYENK